jgi:membrane protein DedA with SNARE-associated domain
MRDLIVEMVRSTGAWGVGVLMLLENVFPPIPSELIMPLGGYLAGKGDLPFWPVALAGTVGSLLGATLWYVVGRRLGKDRLKRWAGRHGAWVAMTPDEIERANGWFQRHGGLSVFACRMIPFLRTVISVPAGIAGMALVPFLLYTAAGTFIWTVALAWAGRILGSQFPQVGRVLGWVTWVVIGGATAWYLYRVVKVHRARKADAAGG